MVHPVSGKSAFDRRVNGMGQDAIDAIRAIESYDGGTGHLLWVLNKLDVADKHRLLCTAVCAFRLIKLSTFNSPDKQHFAVLTEGGDWHDLTGMPMHPILDQFTELRNPIFPVKVGDELFRDLSDAEMNPYAQFGFEIAFAEPEAAKGELVFPLLPNLAKFVDRVVDEFVRFF
jgi:hypothetical protein